MTIRKQAIKALKGMSARDSGRIRQLLDKLAEDPKRRDIDVKPFRDNRGFRMRVGDHRVIFDRDDETRVIEVLRIGPRGDVYK
ncbi:MAG: type II toxin-antitoxin system RelE/ParE family toxin [Gammaproteobacteria bacterium]|nr:type II toxin-antitoxin system RelE/ParE family toxin [Gammaproteobacteria bacterium]